MTEIVVDTSVVVKWYIPEQDHDPARALRDAYLEGSCDLVAPALMPFEAINALKYSGQYEGSRLETAANTLPEYGIDLVPFAEIDSVAAVATTLDIPVYDAAYIALAEQLETTLYTADEALLNDVAGEYRNVAAHIRDYS